MPVLAVSTRQSRSSALLAAPVICVCIKTYRIQNTADSNFTDLRQGALGACWGQCHWRDLTGNHSRCCLRFATWGVFLRFFLLFLFLLIFLFSLALNLVLL